jgi:hypothetical protein
VPLPVKVEQAGKPPHKNGANLFALSTINNFNYLKGAA